MQSLCPLDEAFQLVSSAEPAYMPVDYYNRPPLSITPGGPPVLYPSRQPQGPVYPRPPLVSEGGQPGIYPQPAPVQPGYVLPAGSSVGVKLLAVFVLLVILALGYYVGASQAKTL